MDRSSIRAWRHIQKKRVWRNRLRLIFRAFSPAYVECFSTGVKCEAKTWKELRKVKWCQVYRTTGQPCSCEMCSGERYKRVNFKRAAAKDIRGQLDME
jgi:hypothetical protein